MQGKLERKRRKRKEKVKKERKKLDINDKKASKKQFKVFFSAFGSVLAF